MVEVDVIFDSASKSKWRVLFRMPVSIAVLAEVLKSEETAIGSVAILPPTSNPSYSYYADLYKKNFVVELPPPLRA